MDTSRLLSPDAYGSSQVKLVPLAAPAAAADAVCVCVCGGIVTVYGRCFFVFGLTVSLYLSSIHSHCTGTSRRRLRSPSPSRSDHST